MRKLWIVIQSAVIGLVLFAGSVSAQGMDAGDVPRLPAVQGWVAVVDWVGDKIVINTGGDEITFRLTPDTHVEKNGASISVNDINQGDVVTVHYIDKQHTGLVAVSITDQQPL
ncbi:MAG: hypothetical protein PHH75_05140 [Candidatus Omnitrophica bacterium]|nr:hypothetical protein [Candidatus Omnitrophota bacterium]MDD5574548.1 hypothetical protein [Candidatus Omnitrophota bacterium]